MFDTGLLVGTGTVLGTGSVLRTVLILATELFMFVVILLFLLIRSTLTTVLLLLVMVPSRWCDVCRDAVAGGVAESLELAF